MLILLQLDWITCAVQFVSNGFQLAALESLASLLKILGNSGWFFEIWLFNSSVTALSGRSAFIFISFFFVFLFFFSGLLHFCYFWPDTAEGESPKQDSITNQKVKCLTIWEFFGGFSLPGLNVTDEMCQSAPSFDWWTEGKWCRTRMLSPFTHFWIIGELDHLWTLINSLTLAEPLTVSWSITVGNRFEKEPINGFNGDWKWTWTFLRRFLWCGFQRISSKNPRGCLGNIDNHAWGGGLINRATTTTNVVEKLLFDVEGRHDRAPFKASFLTSPTQTSTLPWLARLEHSAR